MPGGKVRARSWRCRAPMGGSASIRAAAPEASVMSSSRVSTARLVIVPSPRSSATAAASLPGVRAASRSPGRWLQVIPAACRNVAGPEEFRAAGQPGSAQPGGVWPGQPGPAGQRGDQRVGDVAAVRAGAPGDQLIPGELSRGEQRVVVAGQHGHGAWPGPAHVPAPATPTRPGCTAPTGNGPARSPPGPSAAGSAPASSTTTRPGSTTTGGCATCSPSSKPPEPPPSKPTPAGSTRTAPPPAIPDTPPHNTVSAARLTRGQPRDQPLFAQLRAKREDLTADPQEAQSPGGLSAVGT